jgi:hypothetical protein
MEKYWLRSRKPRLTAMGICCADYATLTSPTSGGRSVGIVRSPTEDTEFSFRTDRTVG